jgi:hypothetical protein
MNPMIVKYGEISSGNKYSNRRHNKDATFNVTKAAVPKSILTQITKVRAANGFH